MDSQVKYSSLSQPPSIHASPINYNYNRTCNTTYNSPIGTPYNLNSNSPYNNQRQYNYQDNYPQQQYNQNYQTQQQQLNYNNLTNNLNPQQLNYNNLNTSPYNQLTAGTVDPYPHYGAQHQLPHTLHGVAQPQQHGFPFYDDP